MGTIVGILVVAIILGVIIKVIFAVNEHNEDIGQTLVVKGHPRPTALSESQREQIAQAKAEREGV